MNQSTKRTVFFASIFLLMGLLVFGFVVYQVQAKGNLLAEQAVILKKKQIQESSYFRLIRQAEETSEKRAELKRYFLHKESDSINFLTLVESIAPTVGVELETNNLELLKEKGAKNAWIRTSFSFSGTRQAVQNFIEILESLPYIQRITSLTMTAESAERWQANVTMQVSVLSYDE